MATTQFDYKFDELTFEKDGEDLKIFKDEDLLETYTNFFSNGSIESIKTKDSDGSEYTEHNLLSDAIINIYAAEGELTKDTKFMDNIIGTDGIDQIQITAAGGNTNTINAGKGNDKINILGGSNTIVISGEDPEFVEKITNATSNDTLKLTDYKFSELKFSYNPNASLGDTLTIETPDGGQVQLTQFSKNYSGSKTSLDNIIALNNDGDETSYSISEDAVFDLIIGDDEESYNSTGYNENITIGGDNTLNFAVGCGNKTITLGDNDYNTVLNFITDEREGYVSQYLITQAKDSDVVSAGFTIPQGGIMLTRITGTVQQEKPSSQGLPVNNLTTDRLIITDCLANGQGKITFKGVAAFGGKNGSQHYDAVNDLLENLVGKNTAESAIIMNTINIASGTEYEGSYFGENLTLKGASTVNAGLGNDYITGSLYADTIDGGLGDDNISGGAGNDVIYGGRGHNTLSDGNGNDFVYGGTRNSDDLTYNDNGSIKTGITWNPDGDTISVEKGNDYVYAGSGNDTITVTTFNSTDQNVIYAGAGDDTITVSGVKGSVVNTVYGGEGADTYKVNGVYGSQVFEDANSDDTLIHAAVSGATYSYDRVGKDLVITQTSGVNVQTMTLKNHFTKLENNTQLDKFYIGEEDKSLLANAIINVAVADGKDYTLTAYDEKITAGKSATIILPENTEFTYSQSGNDLIISYGTEENPKSTTIVGYFDAYGNVVDDTLKYQIGDTTETISSLFTGDDAPELIIDNSDAESQQTINDTSDLNKEVIASDHGDNINMTGGGNKKVILGAGDDNVNLGTGSNEVTGKNQGEAGNAINIIGTSADAEHGIEKSVQTINIQGGKDGSIRVQHGASDIKLDGGVATDVDTAEGNDVIELKTGTADINSGAGDDTIFVGKDAKATLTGGAGQDHFMFSKGKTSFRSAVIPTDGSVITDATSDDTIDFDDCTWSDLKFSRGTDTEFNDLKIKYGSNLVTVQNFFSLSSPVNIVRTNDTSASPAVLVEHNIKNEADIYVTLEDGRNYEATIYKEIVSVMDNASATVSGLNKTKDSVLTTTYGGTLSRTDNGGLLVTDATASSSLMITDFFELAMGLEINGEPTSASTEISVNLTGALDSTGGYQATGYTETISGKGLVSGMSADDSISTLNAAELSRIDKGTALYVKYISDNTDPSNPIYSTITVSDFFTNGVDFEINGTSTLNSELNVTLTGAVSDYQGTKYNEIISATGNVTVHGLSENDKIAYSEDIVRTYDGNKNDQLKIGNITVTDFFTTNACTKMDNNGSDVLITSVPMTVNASVNYTASDTYTENVVTTGNISVSNLTKGTDTLTIGDGLGSKTYTRTAGSYDLVVASTKAGSTSTVTITNFFNDTLENDLSIDGTSTSEMPLNVNLNTSVAYEGTKYAETITGTGSVSKLTSSDIISLAGESSFSLNRTYDNLNKDTLKVTCGSNIATITDFFASGGSTITKVGTSDITSQRLAVDAYIDYEADSNFKEDINVMGNINLSDMTSDDTLTVASASLYTLDGTDAASQKTLTIQGTNTVNITDFFDGSSNRPSSINNVATGTFIGSKTLTVTGYKDFNGASYGFGAYDVTGASIASGEAGSLTGYNGADTLRAGAAGDILTGGLGADSLVGGAGVDTFVFAKGDGADSITNASHDDIITITTDLDGFDPATSLIYTKDTLSGKLTITGYGEGDSITVNYDYANPDNSIDELDVNGTTVYISNHLMFDVILSGGTWNKATSEYASYAVNVSGYGNVSGLEAKDKITKNYLSLERAWDGENGDKLTIFSEDGNHLVVTDFFNGNGCDTLNNGTSDSAIKNTLPINVTLSVNTEYPAEANYNEIIKGSGTVSGLSANDYIDFTKANVTYSRLATADTLSVTEGTQTVNVLNYDFTNANTTVKVGGTTASALISDSDVIVVDLTGTTSETAYEGSRYKEIIQNSGYVQKTALTGDDYIDLTKANVTYSRLATDTTLTITDGSTIVNVTGYDFNNQNEIQIGGIGSDNYVKYTDEITVNLNNASNFSATDYKEIITGNGSVNAGTISLTDDKLTIATEVATAVSYSRTNNSNDLVVSGDNTITLKNFNFSSTGTSTDVHVNGLTENDKISKGVIQVSLTDALGTSTYAAASGYNEDITLNLTTLTGVSVSGLSSSDNLNVDGDIKLKRSNNSNVLQVVGSKTVNVLDFAFDNAHNFSLNNTLTATTDTIYVTLSDVGGNPTTYIATDYKEFINGTGIVNAGVITTADSDKLLIDGSVTFERTNLGDLHVKGSDSDITVTGFNWAGGDGNYIYVNDTTSEGKTILVTLNGSLTNTYSAASGYAEDITITEGSSEVPINITVSGLGGSDNIIMSADSSLTRNYDGTAENNNKLVLNKNYTTTNILGYFSNHNGKLNNTDITSLDKILTVNLSNNAVYGTDDLFKENISGVGSVDAANLITANSDQLVVLGSVTYERTNNGDLHVKGTGSDITVTNFDWTGENGIYVNGNPTVTGTEGTEIIVGINNDLASEYTASAYKETITVASGTLAKEVSGLGIGDTLTITGADSFYRDFSNPTALTVKDSAETPNSIITINDYASTRNNFTLTEGIADKELIVNGFATFDATDSSYGWGFKNFNITGSATSKNVLTGGAENDTITAKYDEATSENSNILSGGAGSDMIYGSAGSDTIYAGIGADTVNAGAGNDTIYAGTDSAFDNVADKLFFNGEFGSDTIYTTDSLDELHFDDLVKGNLNFIRSTNDLIIKTDDTHKVTIKNFFAEGSSKIDKLYAKATAEAATTTEYSIKADITLDYVLNEGENFDASTLADYNLNIIGDGVTAHVTGMKASDNITIAGAALSRTYDSVTTTNNSVLTITGTNSTVYVDDFFGTSANPCDTINGNSIATAYVIDTTISAPSADSPFAAEAGYKEAIHGSGYVTYASLSGTNDFIKVANAEYHRSNNDDVIEIKNTTNDIFIKDYSFTAENTNVQVGADSESAALITTSNITLFVDLTNNTNYINTEYKEAISGSGSVTGITADDYVNITKSSAIYNRKGSDSNLQITDGVNDITINNFDYLVANTTVKVGGTDAANLIAFTDVINVDLDNADFTATSYTEIISGEGSVSKLSTADKITMEGAVLSRTYDGTAANNNKLVLTANDKTITVKDFFTADNACDTLNDNRISYDAEHEPVYTIKVAASANFAAETSYKEDVTVSGSINVSNLKPEDTLIMSGETSYSRAYAEADALAISDGTNTATITDYFSATGANNTFVIKEAEGGDAINRSDKELAISGFVNYEVGAVDGLFNHVNITGTASDDDYKGGLGDDIISGGLGNDTIEGKGGSDTLTGGAGNDTFVFEGTELGNDHITDAVAVDTVEFKDLAWTDLTFARGTGANINDLIINSANGSITLDYFFEAATPFDKIITTDGTHSIKEDSEITVELQPDQNYVANILYKEVFTVADGVTAEHPATISRLTDRDEINLTGAELSRVNDGGLILSDGTKEVIVSDFFNNGVDFAINGTVTSEATQIAVTLNSTDPEFVYDATKYTETIQGAGKVKNMSAYDVLKFTDEVAYSRQNGGGLIVTDDTNDDSITVIDFFTNGIDFNVKAGDETSSTAGAQIDVILSYDYAYTGTRYQEFVHGTGSVSGLLENDVINVSDAALTRKWNGTDDNKLFIENTTDSIIVSDFFTDNKCDTLVNESIKNNKTIDVVLDGNYNTAYSAEANYYEHITGTGSVVGSTLDITHDNVDVAGTGTVKFDRDGNSKDVVISNTEGGTTITVKGFFNLTDYITVNNAALTSDTQIDVDLVAADGHYTATNMYKEVISGNGEVSGLNSKDILNVSKDDVSLTRKYDGTNNDTLTIAIGQTDTAFVVTDFFKAGNTYDALNDGSILEDTRITVNASRNFVATAYEEDINVLGDISVTNISITDTLTVSGATTFARNGHSADSLVVYGDDNRAFITDFFAENPHNDFAIYTDDETPVDLSEQTLYVTNFTNYTADAAFKNVDVTGTANNDTLTGGIGADIIRGGAGDDIIEGKTGNDELNGGLGVDKYFFSTGDGQDVLTHNDSNDEIYIKQHVDVTFTRTADGKLNIGYGSGNDKITVNNFNFGNKSANIDKIYVRNEADTDYELITISNQPINYILADGETFDATSAYDLNISIVEGGTASVINLKSTDNIDIDPTVLSRTIDDVNNNRLTVTDGTSTINLNNYFAEGKACNTINADDVKTGYFIETTLATTTEFSAANSYKEIFKGTGIVKELEANDKIYSETLDNTTYKRTNNGGLQINGVTVKDFDFAGGHDVTITNGTPSEDITTLDKRIDVTLDNNLGADAYICASGYAEDITATADATISGIAKGTDKLLLAGVNYSTSFSRISGDNDLTVTGTHTVVVKDFFPAAEGAELAVNNNTTATMTLNVYLNDVDYVGTRYDENVKLAQEVTTANVSGLTSADGIVMAGAALERTYNGETAHAGDNDKLTLSANGKSIVVTDFFSETSQADAVDKLNATGSILATEMTVNASVNFAGTAYTEKVVVSADGINLSNLTAGTDSIVVDGATTFTRDFSNTTLTISGGTYTANITDYFNVANNALTINNGTANIVKSNTTLIVNNATNTDCLTWGFGSYRITGTDDNNALSGGTGNDYINGGKGDDTLYGNTGNDDLYGGEGSDKFTFNTGDGNDTIYDAISEDSIKFADRTNFTGVTFTKGTGDDINSLLISNGANSVITVKNYFAEGTNNMTKNAITKFVLKDDKEYTLEWRHSNVFDDENETGAMYRIFEGDAETEKVNTVIGIPNWVDAGPNKNDVFGNNEHDMLAGNDEDDDIDAGDKAAEIYGGAGNDKLKGSAEGDWIAGNDGNDEIHGGAGDDYLFGGDWTAEADPDGEDEIYGDDGADYIYGRGGDDKLYGDAGNDHIYTGNGSDIVDGGLDDDEIHLAGVEEDENTVVFTGTDFGKDIITNSTLSDTLKFTDYNLDDEFKQGMKMVDDDLVISLGENSVTLKVYTENSVNKVIGKDGETIEIQDIVPIVHTYTVNNKKRTVIGTKYADIIDPENNPQLAKIAGKSKTIKAIDGDDIIIAGAGNDKLYGGAGKNTLIFREGDGKDTVYADANGSDYLEFRDFSVEDLPTFIMSESGKNLTISYGHLGDKVTLNKFLNGDHSVKGMKVYDADGNVILTKDLSAVKDNPSVIELNAQVLNKKNLTGSSLSETIIGSSKNNTLKGGGGNDVIDSVAGTNKVYAQSRDTDHVTVYSGINKDTLYAGVGEDTFVFNKNHGNDTVVINSKAVAGQTVTTLDFSEAGDLSFYEQGKNLVVRNTYERDDSGLTVSETTTIKNYLKGKSKDIVNIIVADPSSPTGKSTYNLYTYLKELEYADKSTLVVGNANSRKKQKINGSFLDETLVGGNKADTIKSGSGIDLINGGKGNDKINGYVVTEKVKSGKKTKTIYHYTDEGDKKYATDNAKTFVFNAGDGNDVVYYSKSSDTYLINVRNLLETDVKFLKKGNHLIIKYGNNDSIKDYNYFKLSQAQAIQTVKVVGIDGFYYSKEYKIYDQVISMSGKGKIADTLYNDAITGSKKKDTYTISKGGNDTITDAKGNDKYNLSKSNLAATSIIDNAGNDTYTVKNFDQIITIDDKAGKDSLIFSGSAVGKHSYLFDVTSNGKFNSNTLYVFGDILTTTDEETSTTTSSFVQGNGHITVNEFFNTVPGGTAGKDSIQINGTGCLETIKDSTKGASSVTFDTSVVASIAQNVASWLGTSYDSVSDAINSDTITSDKLAELAQLYAGFAK